MADNNILKFEELMREDEELQARLRAAFDAFAGDKDDEQALFDSTLGMIAAEVGLPFTLEEAHEAMKDGFEISERELEAVAGGVSVCDEIGLPPMPLCWGVGDPNCPQIGMSSR